MAQLVSCARCRVEVPVGDTTFDANGNYLCRKCTDVVDLANQVELARQEAIRKANVRPRGSLVGLIQGWLAERAARRDHAKLVASMPNLDTLPTLCMQCRQPAPRGRSLCANCEPHSPS